MKSLLTLIEEIRLKPTMYIGRYTIECFRAYIDGWIQGQDWKVTGIDTINGFQDWIERFYNLPQTQSWDRIIHFHSADSADALTQFFKLYDRYRAETAKPSPDLPPS